MPFTSAQLRSFRETYARYGFVIVDGLIPPRLLPQLEAAADRITTKGRTAAWPHVRVVGRQFPPFPEGSDIWGVQHIMHPALQEPCFAEWYGSEDMLDVSAALMGGCSRKEMQLELFNLLVNPLENDYALSWHRDDVRAEASAEEEEIALGKDHHGVQWNAALYDDDCLKVVPGSHSRSRTPEERSANLSRDPSTPMPGVRTASLKKGQTVFYNNNIVHKGQYNLEVKRRTLHGCYGSPPPGDTTRARNILQHNLSYTSTPDFRKSLPASLLPLLDRLLEMQRLVEGQEMEYSQDA